jgi:hypothetical protein
MVSSSSTNAGSGLRRCNASGGGSGGRSSGSRRGRGRGRGRDETGPVRQQGEGAVGRECVLPGGTYWTGTRRRQHTQHRQAERRMEALHSSGRAGRRRLCLDVWRVWVCLSVCVVSVRLSLLVVRPTTACTSALWCVSLAACHRSPLDAGRSTLDARRSTLDARRSTLHRLAGPCYQQRARRHATAPSMAVAIFDSTAHDMASPHHTASGAVGSRPAGTTQPHRDARLPKGAGCSSAAAMFAGNARPSRASHRHVVEANSTRRTVQRRRP